MGIRKHILMLCLLVPVCAVGRPISYVGGHTAMFKSDSIRDSYYWHYTPDIRYSLGLDLVKNKLTQESYPAARFTFLVHRENFDNAQLNLYLESSISFQDADDYSYGARGDWETRRLFVGFAVRKSRDRPSGLLEQSYEAGFAPYLGDYGDLHTWVLVRTRRNDMNKKWSTYPVLKFFKGSALAEFGYTGSSGWDAHLMYRF